MKALLQRVFCMMVLLSSVIGSKAAILTIGSGTGTSGVYPINSCFGYNYTQSIYLASELVTAGATAGTAGYIYSIQYNQTTATSPTNWKDWVIYMGNTTATAFTTTTSWLPISGMSNVFSGTVTPSGTGWYTITLTTPFYWDGTSNIVVAIDENTPSFTCTSNWQVTSIGSGTNYRSISYYSDATNPNPSSPPSATTRGLLFPNVKLDYTPAVPCTGTPTGGTATASATTLCPGGSTTITVSGATSALGLTYTWESATSATGPWTTVTGATGTSLSLTPSPCTNTYYRRVTTCTASAISTPSSTVLISVSCAILPPYVETFESITTANQFPNCMTATSVGSLVYTYLSAPGSYNRTNHTPGGAKFASFRYSANDYMFTPGLMLTAGKTYKMSFWYITDGLAGWTTLSARMGNAATAAAMTTTLGTISGANNVIYKEFTSTFTATSTGVQYIGIFCNATGGPWYLSIDDIGLQELPPCAGKPVPGTPVSDPSRICSSGSPTLSLTGTSGVTGLTYRWESSMTGTAGSFGAIPGGTTAVFTAPSISSGTYYRAVVTCSLTGDTAISSVLYVPAGPYNTPYSETFEDITGANQLPVCMTATSIAPYVYTYLAATGSYNQTNHTPGGSKYASFRYGSNDYLFTPGINMVAGRTYEFSFWYITDGLTGWNTLSAAMGSSATAAAMTTPIGTPLGPLTNTGYQQYKVRFIAPATGVRYFGIFCNGTTAPWYLSVDDILLQELPPCSGTPTTGVPTANPVRICGAGTTTLDLPGLTPAIGFNFRWQDSVAGGTWGTGPGRPSFGGFTVPFGTGTVSTNTWFRCIVTCAATGDSAISPALFVPAGALNLPYNETFESIAAANQLPVCMSATSIAPYVYTFLSAPGSYNRTNHTPGGSKFASFRYGANDYLFTPGINFTGGYKYIFSFWYITDGLSGWTTLRGAYGNDATPSAMSATMKTISGATNSTYLKYTDTVTISSSGIYYFGIFCNATSAPWYLSVDDINIQPVPCSGTPDGGVITGTIPSGAGACAGTPIILRDSGATPSFIPGIAYRWQRRPVGGGTWTDIAGATSDIYTADTAIGWDYRFAVTCTNSGLVSYSPVYSLPALPPHPPVTITGLSGPIRFCLGDTVWLNATNYPGAVYTWKRNGKVVPGWSFSDLGAVDSGTYIVEVNSSRSPCTAVSAPVQLVANDPGFSVAIAPVADSFLCEGDSVILKGVPDIVGVTVQWQRDGVDIPGATDLNYMVSASGSYRITASNGSGGCNAISRTIMIRISPVPTAVITSPNPSYTACEEDGLVLNATAGDGYFYQWSRNGSPIFGMTDSSITALLPGVYSVKIRNASNCVSVSEDVTVKILPSPVPVIARTGFILGTTMPFAAYQWYRNGILMPGRVNDTLHLTHNGLYTVRVKGDYDCFGTSLPIEIFSSELGLATTQQQEVRIFPNPAQDQVFLEVPVPFTVTVKDVTGRSLQELRDVPFVNMSRYSDGIYLFVIRDASGNILLNQRISKRSGK